MSNTPDNIRNMWEQAAMRESVWRDRQDNNPMFAGAIAPPNDAQLVDSSLALVRKQREEAAARKAAKNNASSLALVRKQREEADARKAALIKSSADEFAAERDARRASGTYES